WRDFCARLQFRLQARTEENLKLRGVTEGRAAAEHGRRHAAAACGRVAWSLGGYEVRRIYLINPRRRLSASIAIRMLSTLRQSASRTSSTGSPSTSLISLKATKISKLNSYLSFSMPGPTTRSSISFFDRSQTRACGILK